MELEKSWKAGRGAGVGQNQIKFPQEIINNKIIFLRILAKKIYMPLEGKKDFHLNIHVQKKVLHQSCMS